MTMRAIILQLLAIGAIGVAAARAQAPGVAPCALLTTDEVRKVFADAKPGVADHANDKYGIFSCVWTQPSGRLQIITGEEEQTPAEEARTWVDAFADPLKSGAIKHVRFEKVPGVGDAAVAVVETVDQAKGFMRDGAYIVVRRGKQQVAILSPDLAERGRPAAIAALTELGRAVANRLR